MRHRGFLVPATAAGVLLGSAPAFAVSGGQPVPDPSAAPWMVTIARAGDRPLTEREMCGGVLIAADRVATAAHCLDHTDPTKLEVHLGASVLSSNPGTVLSIRGFATDPGYQLVPSATDPNDFSKSAAKNDVAIIVLTKPVAGVRPTHVADGRPTTGTKVSAYGHGLTKPYDQANPLSSIGDVLQRADLAVIDDKQCNSQLGGAVDAKSVVCAQAKETICSGDSGGPLLHQTPAGPELVGITSFGGEVIGKDCGQDGYAGGFADTASLKPWITQHHPVLAPMPTGEPTIDGTPASGAAVGCVQPKWAGAAPDSVSYQWSKSVVGSDGFKFFNPIKGATGAQLAITQEFAGRQVLCTMTASTAGGAVEMNSAPVDVVS
jgi:secreted trypsin-like serine protease